MNCAELQDFLHGYVDGELDLPRHLEIERHLQECSTCSGVVNQQQALRQAIRGASLYYRAPARLEERVRSSLPAARKSWTGYTGLGWRALGIAASVALVALLAWGLLRIRFVPSTEDLLAQQVVSSHVRSLMADSHLLDVTSSDQHTVKPWFNGRVDFSPVVKDLTEEGYPLVGGRLDYVDEQKAAALVYKHGKHVINLFVWPAATAADGPTRELTRRGLQVFHWTQAGLNYWAVSDLNEKALGEFVALIRR